jgi:hypothetical protein
VKKFIAHHVRRSSGEAFQIFRLVLPYVSVGGARRVLGDPSVPL